MDGLLKPGAFLALMLFQLLAFVNNQELVAQTLEDHSRLAWQALCYRGRLRV